MLTDRRFDRWLFAVLWLLLLTYALLFAPPVPADLLGQLRDLALARVQAVDPIAIAVFNLLGVLPVAFLAILLFDTGKPSPWPFALGSFVLGGFVLLPYLVIRDLRAPLQRAPGAFVRALGSPITGVVLLLTALGLIGFAVLAGDLSVFAAQLQDSAFIAVMSADLLVLTIALHRCAVMDRQRRGLRLSGWSALAVHMPLLGPLLYLALRQPASQDDLGVSPDGATGSAR
ncbi:hypothetical protein CKO42_18110 [Lamprobacter modestohalophilus]|uniref:DUF2834 domain-containing protein n=1 Tax=Lamprobacter modestohalophilus TaxID=1064514 RepID=A0A9X0WB26_9GAMM|nr:hypothetical protein [Lamprobacter modestohalophilus]MBK1620320.1 hypothetical protein [Lamprobacter modestohalophilus]